MSVLQHRYAEYARSVGESAVAIGQTATMKKFGCSRGFARYHEHKERDPSWHGRRWGGSRGRARYSEEVEEVMRFALWQEVSADPLRTSAQFATVLATNGFHVSQQWVDRCFKRWGVSHQKPSYRNLNKFTISNILYYRYNSAQGVLLCLCVWLANVCCCFCFVLFCVGGAGGRCLRY